MKMDGVKIIELKIPPLPEYICVARLALSGIASRMNFNYETIEDLKIVTSEACNNAIQHAYKGNGRDKFVTIRYLVSKDKLTIEVEDKGKGMTKKEIEKFDIKEGQERGLGLFLIKTLTDDYDIVSEKDKGTKIRMVKFIK